jgi:quinoprotein dehydrogenase-associated probable ABC transporter substrate-binding protein
MRGATSKALHTAALGATLTMAVALGQAQAAGEFRVCADPNNLPFSNARGEGFENKLAELFARDLGESVTYTWWAERRGFIRHTLKAGDCDVLMEVPVGLAMVETTQPYYRSGYVFVSRRDRGLDIAALSDPRLKNLKIGVQLIGNDGFNTPPAHALADQGMRDNVVGYTVYGDYRQPNPPAAVIDGVASGAVDIAAVWGPLAGYFAHHSEVPLLLTPIADTARFKPLVFEFDMAIGVRKGDHQRRDDLDALIARHKDDIAALLKAYDIPLSPAVASGDEPPHGQ